MSHSVCSISSGMDKPLQLWYWVRGSSYDSVSWVGASQDTTFMDFQESIMKSWSRDSDQTCGYPHLYMVPKTHPVDLQDDAFVDVLGALSISDLGRHFLISRTKVLGNPFISRLKPGYLHFVVDFPSHPYQITCWFRGGHVDDKVYIELSGDEPLATSTRIKCKELWLPLKDVFLGSLQVYKISFKDRKELEEILDTVGAGVPVYWDGPVRDAFQKIPFSSQTLSTVIEASVDTVEDERFKFLDKNQSQRPSTTTLSMFQERQAKSAQFIPCGRPRGDEDRIPVTLLHPVFAQFKEDIQSIPLTAEDNALAFALANYMSRIWLSETSRTKGIDEEILQEYGIDLYLDVIREHSTGYEYDTYRCVIAESNSEVGHIGEEPYFQAIGYYLESTRPNAVKMWHSPLPCFLLSICGPYIDFAGAAWNLRPSVQLLGRVAFHVHSTDTEDLLVLARHMAAFRKATRALKEYYETLSPPTSSRPPLSQLFPHPTTYTSRVTGEKTEIVYKRQVSKTQLVFFGFEGSRKGHRICIKFVRRYSADAHECCASLGCAPTLRGFETIVGGWFMVVMDDISDEYITLIGRPISETVRKAIAAKLSALHKAGYVHGDVRDANIMTCKSNAKDFKFIDFDWAGKVDEVMYPPFVNREIWRPEGATDWLPIRPEHDIEMVNHIKGWAQDSLVQEA